MPHDQLQQFFHEKKEKAKPADVDWSAKRDAWIKAVVDLFRTVEDDYLHASKSDVEITRSDKVVSENYMGEYHIPELNLRVADEQVVLSPKAANVLGAKGRIDVRGDRGDATIVWQGDNQWSIVVSRTPALRLVPLTANSLAEVLRGVMRP
ncbi:MAG TPA: hypothetical protein VND64_17005 [Pirellulales bacterium]|nr:hypothetical protein [Pirellulales bacterium]